MKKLGSIIIGCVAVLALASCASDASGAPTSSTSSANDATTVTEIAPTTTVPLAPTPTTIPAEEQLKADFASALQARQHCTDDPATCDYAAIALPASEMDAEVHNLVAMRVQLNLRTKPDVGTVTTTVQSASVNGDAASLTACSYDTATLFDIADPANPNDDVVFDDSQYSTRSEYQLSRLGGKWLIASAKELEKSPGAALCVS